MDVAEYLNTPGEHCQCCGLPGPTVRRRQDPYARELRGDLTEVPLCDPCTRERRADI